jgi:hypothetical protein
MTVRNIAELEDLLRTHSAIDVDGRRVGADWHKAARMIAGRLEQGEVLIDAVVETINFYDHNRRGGVTRQTPGVASLVEVTTRWWAAPAPLPLSEVEREKRRAEVTASVQEIFESTYAGAYKGSWLDVDTNGFDLDPVAYLQAIADRFDVRLPPYGTNREIIEFVLARWQP